MKKNTDDEPGGGKKGDKARRKKVVRSLLAGLAQESSDPDAADQRHADMCGGIEEDDYLLPPQGGETPKAPTKE